MKTISKRSLRYKLLIFLLCLGITAFAVTGTIAYIKHLHSLREG